MVSTIFLPQASSSAHQDPIKEFVECLYVNYDFDLAQQKLLECEKVRGGEASCWVHLWSLYLSSLYLSCLHHVTSFQPPLPSIFIVDIMCNIAQLHATLHPPHLQVLDHDFFLVACRAEFIENARLSIFETFCRVHQCISIRLVTWYPSNHCC